MTGKCCRYNSAFALWLSMIQAGITSLRRQTLLNSRTATIIAWSIGLVVLTIAAYWVYPALGKLGQSYATAQPVIVWGTCTIAFCLSMLLLWRMVSTSIYNMVAPADLDEANNKPDYKGRDINDTKKFANVIAFSVVVGLTLIALLLTFDYQGHASINAEADGRSQQLATGTRGTPPSTSIQGFIKAAGPHLGTFGDFFGGVVNPLLTFGTLVGLAVTILLQRIQIREARAEARVNHSHAQTQAFETTFFHLLNLHAENIQNLTFDPQVVPTPTQKGPIQQLQKLAGIEPQVMPPALVAHGRAIFGEVLRSTSRGASAGYSQLDVYRALQKEHNDVLGHYFRHLYQILNLVNSFAVEGNEEEQYKTRKRYTNILRAQMSAHELAVLLLNCTFRTVDDGKFRNLVVWYKFLEHLPMQEKNGELSIPNIDQDIQWVVYDYFDTGGKDGRTWLPGAFGKHPVVRNHLSRQGSTWCGPVPWTAQTITN